MSAALPERTAREVTRLFTYAQAVDLRWARRGLHVRGKDIDRAEKAGLVTRVEHYRRPFVVLTEDGRAWFRRRRPPLPHWCVRELGL